MESGIDGISSRSVSLYQESALSAPQSINSDIIDSINPSNDDDSDAAIISLSNAGSQPLSIEDALKRVNELLTQLGSPKAEELDPSEHTSEKTAETIVNGISGMFGRFLQSNPELSNEEALDSFFKAARSGIASGFDDALEMLKSSGVLSTPHLEDDLSETRSLVESKLTEFEKAMRERFASDTEAPGAGTSAAPPTAAPATSSASSAATPKLSVAA